MSTDSEKQKKDNKYVAGIPGEELQYIQDCYAKVANIFVVCKDAQGNSMTQFSGDLEELALIQEHVPKDYFQVLLSQLRDNPYEEQVIADSNCPYIKLVGTAITVCGKPVIFWCSFAVIQNEEQGWWSRIKTVVTPQELRSRMELSRVLVRKLFAESFLVMNANEEAKKSRLAQEKMKEELHRNQAMTRIVRNLDSSEKYEDIVENVLESTMEYLKADVGNLFKVNRQEKVYEILCRIDKTQKKECLAQKNIGFEEWPLSNERPVFISSNVMLPEITKKQFEAFGIKALASLPVFVNDEVVMYFNIIDVNRERAWQVSDINLLSDVCKVIQSILAKRIAKNSLDSSYKSMETILDNVGCGILVTDKSSDEILFTNHLVNLVFGEELEQGNLPQKLRAGKKISYNSKLKEFYEEKSKHWYDLHYTEFVWVDGREAVLCALYDVTDKRNYQKKIEQHANNDFLTGLYNRMRCERDLKKCVERVKNNKKSGSLIYLDLDNFKNINDGLGHQYGDILLQSISNSMKGIKEIENTCYRMGGDEFIMILPEEYYERKQQVLEQLVQMFNKPWCLNNTDYYCTASIGVVDFPNDANDASDIIKKADIAMYEAKKMGKNTVYYYTESSGSSSKKRLDLEKNMRDSSSIGFKDFIVYYQPIMDMKHKDGVKCRGAEALLRWKHHNMGMVSPAEFIPLAEYLGLINPIGTHVLRQACKACKNWNELGHPDYKVNVNLSVVQLLQNNIVDIIKDTVEEVGIDPKNLILEVTESLAINDMATMKRVLSDIRALGIDIALDDFGTGYSSLNHIKEIPLDVIKIDQTFVTDIENDEYAKAFIKMISELAETLDLSVCVEGVEKKEQLRILEEMQVKYIQGFYYDKAIPLEEFETKYIFNTSGIR